MCTRTCAVLFLFLKLQTCYGNYDCFKSSSGKDICFMFEDTLRTFEESKLLCQNNGGFLLEIYDSEMQGFVEQFVKSKTTFLREAWLNLMRINSNTWVWGGQQGNAVTYSNWGSDNPVSTGINQAFMNSIYRWFNSYNPNNASTICIQGNGEHYFTTTTTTYEPFIPTPTTTAKTTTTTINIYAGSSASSVNNEPIQTSTSNYANALVSSSSTGVGIGVGIGVGLGVLVLIIVSSLLVAKFVFHKEIPVPFKSSRSENSPSPQTSGKDDNKGGSLTVAESQPHGDNLERFTEPSALPTENGFNIGIYITFARSEMKDLNSKNLLPTEVKYSTNAPHYTASSQSRLEPNIYQTSKPSGTYLTVI